MCGHWDHGGISNLQARAGQPRPLGSPNPSSPGQGAGRWPCPGDMGGVGDTHGAEGQRPHHPVLPPRVQLVEVLVRHQDSPVPALPKAVDLRRQGWVRGHTREVTQRRWPGRTSPWFPYHLADVAGEEDGAEVHLGLEGLEASGEEQRQPRVLLGLWGATVELVGGWWHHGVWHGVAPRGAPWGTPKAVLTEER